MSYRNKPSPFYKLQAAGNDVVLLDQTSLRVPNAGRLAKKICDRKFGVGADQLVLLEKSRKADFKVFFYNPDGSMAEMCGNGIRCVGRYLRETEKTKRKELQIETVVGIRKLKIFSKEVKADLGAPVLKGKDIPVHLSGRIINRPVKIESKEFRITCLSFGNPHCVIFQENVDQFPVERYGPLIENFHLFPKRVNVSFVHVLTPSELRMRVWERGVGETLACGTAAAAALVASCLNGYTDKEAQVTLPGGKLHVSWDRDKGATWLSGPAQMVFKGEIVL